MRHDALSYFAVDFVNLSFCVAAAASMYFQFPENTFFLEKGQRLCTAKHGSARCNVETHHRVAAAANENDFVNTPAKARFLP